MCYCQGPNCGSYFVRNVPWSWWWLDKWWSYSKDIKDFAWNDQLGAWDAIVHHYATNGSRKQVPTPFAVIGHRGVAVAWASLASFISFHPDSHACFRVWGAEVSPHLSEGTLERKGRKDA